MSLIGPHGSLSNLKKGSGLNGAITGNDLINKANQIEKINISNRDKETYLNDILKSSPKGTINSGNIKKVVSSFCNNFKKDSSKKMSILESVLVSEASA